MLSDYFSARLGFIVVAACVITFEMRDSAAKVMPAKYKPADENGMGTTPSGRQSSNRSSRGKFLLRVKIET